MVKIELSENLQRRFVNLVQQIEALKAQLDEQAVIIAEANGHVIETGKTKLLLSEDFKTLEVQQPEVEQTTAIEEPVE